MFAHYDGIECASAGLDIDADVPMSAELAGWADLIFVMERKHKAKLSARFGRHLNGKRVICLDIPDRYQFMAPALVEVLRAKVTPFLPGRSARGEGRYRSAT